MAKVSEIELIPIKTKRGLIFFASCTFVGGPLYLGNIAVYTRPDGSGFRCIFPTKILPNGQQISLYHPLDRKTGDAIEKAISAEARRLLLSDELSSKPKKGGEENG